MAKIPSTNGAIPAELHPRLHAPLIGAALSHLPVQAELLANTIKRAAGVGIQ